MMLTVGTVLTASQWIQPCLCVLPKILFQRMVITSSKLVSLTRLRFRYHPKILISFGVVSRLVEQAVMITERIVELLTAAAMVVVVASPPEASASQLLRLSLHWQKKEVTFMMWKSSTAFTWGFQWARQTLPKGTQIPIDVVILVENSLELWQGLAIGTWSHHLTNTIRLRLEGKVAKKHLNADKAKNVVLVLILANNNFCGKLVGRFFHSGPLIRFAVSAPITALHLTATKPQQKAKQTSISTDAWLLGPATKTLRKPHAVVASTGGRKAYQFPTQPLRKSARTPTCSGNSASSQLFNGWRRRVLQPTLIHLMIWAQLSLAPTM